MSVDPTLFAAERRATLPVIPTKEGSHADVPGSPAVVRYVHERSLLRRDDIGVLGSQTGRIDLATRRCILNILFILSKSSGPWTVDIAYGETMPSDKPNIL